MPSMMIVSAIQPEGRSGDMWCVGLRSDRGEVNCLAGILLRFVNWTVIHPYTSTAVILEPTHAEVGHERPDTWIGSKVPHEGSAIRVAFGSNAVRIDFLLRKKVAEDPALDSIPEIIVGLFRVGDERTVREFRLHPISNLIVHVSTAEFFRISREVAAMTGFSTVIVSHDGPSVLHVIPLDGRCSHPAMDVQQPGRISGSGFYCVSAVNTDFFTKNVSADVGIASGDTLCGSLLDELFIEVSLVWIKMFP